MAPSELDHSRCRKNCLLPSTTPDTQAPPNNTHTSRHLRFAQDQSSCTCRGQGRRLLLTQSVDILRHGTCPAGGEGGGGGRMGLELSPAVELLGPGFVIQRVSGNSSWLEEVGHLRCLYTGHVTGQEEDSLVSVSLCDGMNTD
ncbi:hypothetical protein ACOMHN_018395 [Nucella lapillus]